MSFGRSWLPDGFGDERVVAMGKDVAALIAVEGWREAPDVNALSDPSFVPA